MGKGMRPGRRERLAAKAIAVTREGQVQTIPRWRREGDFQASYPVLESEIDRMKEESNRLRQMNESLTKEMADLKANNSKLWTETGRLKDEVIELRQENESLTDKITDLETNNRELLKRLEAEPEKSSRSHYGQSPLADAPGRSKSFRLLPGHYGG